MKIRNVHPQILVVVTDFLLNCLFNQRSFTNKSREISKQREIRRKIEKCVDFSVNVTLYNTSKRILSLNVSGNDLEILNPFKRQRFYNKLKFFRFFLSV